MKSAPPAITGFGAYLPKLRLERSAIAAATGWAAGLRGAKPVGRRSYCAWDEDSVTLAVEAARDCLAGSDRRDVGTLVFASTTHPFADRCNAGVVAEALDLDESLRTTDAGGHQRAGLDALVGALLAPGRDDRATLVVAADRRIARPGSEQESRFGHGAAAFTVGGRGAAVAELAGHASLRADFVDHYRADSDGFDYALEERWVRDEGYLALLPRTVAAALQRAGLAASDVTHLIVQGPNRFATAVAKACGVRAEAVEPDKHDACGDLGVAHPLLLLGGVLERAAAGATIVVAGFGQGCDTLVLRATGAPAARGRGCQGALDAGVANDEYLRFLANCGVVEMDWGMRAERDNRTAHAAAWRHHRDVTAFVGGRCSRCGTVQFPRSRACVNPDCREFDTQQPAALAELGGRVKTFTEDWLAVTRSPPHVYGNVELHGGGNVFIEFADTRPGELQVGTPVRFVFRVKDYDALRSHRRYFWKAVAAGA